MKRYFALNLTIIALLVAGYIHGSVAYVFANDISYLTYVILALTIAGVGLVGIGKRDDASLLSSLVIRLGFIGTMIGFLVALAGVDPSRAGDLDAVTLMVTNMVAGIATAITTTLAGLVGNVWLRVVLRLT